MRCFPREGSRGFVSIFLSLNQLLPYLRDTGRDSEPEQFSLEGTTGGHLGQARSEHL